MLIAINTQDLYTVKEKVSTGEKLSKQMCQTCVIPKVEVKVLKMLKCVWVKNDTKYHVEMVTSFSH